MNRALSLSASSIALLAVSSTLSSSAQAHQVGFKSPSPGMHFTEGQPLVVYADLLDDREWKGLIVCPNGQTLSNKDPPPDYSAPRVAQCSGGGTPTGWPQFQVLVDGAPQTDTFTGQMTVTNTIAFDHNGNDSPIDLFPFSVKGVAAGSHQVVIRGFFSADAVTIATVDSPPLTVVVDPAPASKTVVQLNAANSKGTINWNNVIVVGNGNAVTPSGAFVIKNSLVTGVSGFTGTVSSIDIEGSIFEDTGNMTLTSGAATIVNNEWRANNRLTFVPDNPSVPFIFNFNGTGNAQKTFQGNRVGAGQLGFTGSSWLIGGDTDAAGNVIIGPRGVLNCGISNSIVRGNFDHHVYAPGMWSQGYNFSFVNSGSNVLIEHNFIRDSSWPIQNLVGEFRYNVIFGYGHTWLRTAASGTSIHHNLWVPGGNDEVFNGFQDYLGETGLNIYNNTFDGGGAAMGTFDGPFLAMTGGSQVLSFRNNLITFSNNMLNSNPGVTAIQGGASSYLYADYNSFYSPDNSTRTNYDFSPAGAHDVSGAGMIGVANGQLSSTPFAGARVSVDDSKNIERTIEGVIDESAVWQGMQGISRVLAIFRQRYMPKAGSPIIDAGDPQDNDSQGRKADIGAIDSNGHDQDKLGKFGMPPSETVPPTVTLTAPSAGATLTGTATVSATAMDNAGGSGVVLVQFLVDGGVVAQSSTSPYTATFNSAGFTNGSHALSARAWDAAGNTALSAAVMATTMNMKMVTLPPTGQGGAGGSTTTGAGGAGGAGAGGAAGAGGQSGTGGISGGSAGTSGGNAGAKGQMGAGGNGGSGTPGEKPGAVAGGCGCSAGQGPAGGSATAVSLAVLIGLVIRRTRRGR